MQRPVLVAVGALIATAACSAPQTSAQTATAAPPATAAPREHGALLTEVDVAAESPDGEAAGPAAPEPPWRFVWPMPKEGEGEAEPEATPAAPTRPAFVEPSLESMAGKLASEAVATLPGVRGLCAEAVARGAKSCFISTERPPSAPCRDSAVSYQNLDCWWTVAVMETMEYEDGSGHANRLATLYVEPKTLKAIAAEDPYCPGLFTLEGFRKHKVRQASGAEVRTDDAICEGALPFPAPP